MTAPLDQRIIDAVRAHPGLTLYRLSILLDVDEQQLDKAIMVLASEGRLNDRKHTASVRWYDPTAPEDQAPPAGPADPGTRAWEALMTAGASSNGVSPEEIAKHARMNAAYAYRVLRRLETLKLMERCGDERRWLVTPEGRQRLAGTRSSAADTCDSARP